MYSRRGFSNDVQILRAVKLLLYVFRIPIPYPSWCVNNRMECLLNSLAPFLYPLDKFYIKFYVILEFYEKIIRSYQFSFRSDIYSDFTWRPACISRQLFMGEIIETRILQAVHFPLKSYRFRGNETKLILWVYISELAYSAINHGIMNVNGKWGKKN
jgi:hypothetical protein